MPHRRRTTASVFALVVTAALPTGCAIELPAGSVPAPFSIAPTPSGSAGVPKYVCSTIYKILTDGAVRVAEQASASEEDLGRTFTDMAAKVDDEAGRVTDAGLRTALNDISADLNAGAKDPKGYMGGGFQTVGQKLDGECG